LSNLFSALLASDSNDISEVAKAAALGIDMSFMSNALFIDKPILEIEGYEKQGKMFDDFSAGLQEYLLNGSLTALSAAKDGTVKKSSTDKELVAQWLEFWHEGNVEGFKNSYNINDEILGDTFDTAQDTETNAFMEEYYNALLTKRDQGMADYVDGLLQEAGSHTYFVVVGSLHYISDYSILNILQNKGYVITQIK
jgi:uncharacterized protein YbaP (TraB family)